ncbi:MAG: YkuD protein [Deltaproteobacteria bacterium]|nr:YkuD protein [Deltaproteobacteria bacterium]
MQAKTQEHDLWRAGAEVYALEEYQGYKSSLKKGNESLLKENGRFGWFRDYEVVTKEFRTLLAQGEQLSSTIQDRKKESYNGIIIEAASLRDRINSLKKITDIINEGRLARNNLTRAELLTNEAGTLISKERYREAAEKLKSASSQLDLSVGIIRPITKRFEDRNQLNKWRSLVDETIKESRKNQGYAVIVNKAERTLTLYRNGATYKSYPVGLGFNGMKDKVQAGDRATPEGRYRIVKKLPRSRFHKALLINYPNENDKRQFAKAKRKGAISTRADIGGLIEIHGGGKESMTFGCVSLENSHIDELFLIVSIGTPVTIVGAVDYENSITTAVRGL